MRPESALLPAAYTLYTPQQRNWLLVILFLVATCNYVDRLIIGILLEPIKREFGASDTMLGLLTGFSFAIFYAAFGLPVARLADRSNRRLIISVALVIWSVMTMMCGFAQNFWQLVAFRFGVGAGEAGAIPPGQSLLADYFPPEKRGWALGVFMMSGSIGYFIAYAGGGQITEHFGWRAAIIVMAIPGLWLATLVYFGIREPRTLPGRAIVVENSETLRQSWNALRAKPGFINLTIAMVLYFLNAYGAQLFFTSFAIRVYGTSIGTVGVVYGVMAGVTAVVGAWLGGSLTDRLALRDPRWIAWASALFLVLSGALFMVALLMPSFSSFIAMSILPALLVGAAGPALFTHLHAICGAPRRATSVAITFFFANLLGLGLGPIFAGAMSDWFTSQVGPEGIRWSLVIGSATLLPAGWFMARAARTLATDAEA